LIKSYKDLRAYQLSYRLAMEVFAVSKSFPKDEIYSLTNQIRRSSRSVPANIVEGWAKRDFENIFKRHLLDAFGSSAETKLWLDFAKDCDYLAMEGHRSLYERYEQLSKMIHRLLINWKTYNDK
jgi:four helix bundle protein